jgi:hypothetical protein
VRRESHEPVRQARPEVARVDIAPVTDEDRDKPCLLELVVEPATRERSFDRLVAVAPERKQRLAQVADHRQVLVNGQQLKPRYSRHLPEGGLGVGKVLERAKRNGEIEGPIFEGQLFGGCLDQVDGAVLAGTLERDRRKVDPDDFGIEGLYPAFPTADVDRSQTPSKLGDEFVRTVINVEAASIVQPVVQRA